MTKLAIERTSVVGFLCILALSSAIMLWLLWRFPIGTAIGIVVVLSAFGVSARLARSIENEGLADLGHGNRGV